MFIRIYWYDIERNKLCEVKDENVVDIGKEKHMISNKK
tara:strand:+ start:7835 stop:7948 length:114 start_codon:yes stop_codon:yes gene_type:complete